MKESAQVWFLDVVHEAPWKALDAAGMKCHDGTGVSREAIVAGDLGPVHGLVLRSRIRLDAEVLHALPDLQWIARSGSGLENIDLATAAELDIAVHSSPEGNRDAVGEHCIGMLLGTLHKLPSGDASIRQHQWLREAHRGRELKSMTVGIVGYGHMGSAFAERLAGFGCRVMAYDKYKEGWGTPTTMFSHTSSPWVGIHSVSVDVVSLHPGPPRPRAWWTTRGLACLRTPFSSSIPPEAPLSKPRPSRRARRWARDRSALDVLEFEGRSLEALDGLADEEMRAAFEQLLAHPSVLLSPHVAGWTLESYVKLSTVLADKILGQL